MKRTVWTLMKRLQLQTYLKESYKISDIGEKMNISLSAIYIEIKRGTRPDEFEEGRYGQYNPYLALKNEAVRVMGEESFEALVNHMKNNEEATL